MMDRTPQGCRDAWQQMTEACADGPVRNYVQVLDMRDFVVETGLFPLAALEAYSAWNTGKELTTEQREYFNANRGGAQGDYRDGMAQNIANSVDCLTRFPQSKRAIITVCNEPMPDHASDADAKCVRELHLYLDDDGNLSGTLTLRAQAASLFPKNIHMVGTIMARIADQLPGNPDLGTVFYLATLLVPDRS